MISDLSDATPEQLLHAAEDSVREARLLEVRKLELLLAWADLHSGDPQAEPGAVLVRYGGPRLITLGGDGTPEVADLALVEMAIARHEHVLSTRGALADAFDLRHRLPQTWAGVREGRCEAWVVRRVARMSRTLDRHQIRIVDEAVAAALDQAPSRILAIAEAKVIEADPAAHQARIGKNQNQKGVWYPKPRPGSQVDDTDNQAGVSTVFARLDEADALAHQHTVDDLAAALAEHADVPEGAEPLGMDHWRAEAFAMLADPAAVLAFLNGIDDTPGTSEVEEVAQQPSRDPRSPTAELIVHLSLTDTGALGPLARIENLGPRLLTQVRSLLRRHATITVQPVIDLHTGRSVNGYEHPTDVKHRTQLRTIGDVFPHATGLFVKHGRPPDHDHTVPYDKHGPPGQTGDHNDTPLARHHHRAKTHHGYTVMQLGPDKWIWGTPHGLYRLVTGGGTRPITQAEYQAHAQQAIVLADDYAA